MTMIPTDRPQKPRECEHYLGVARCEFQDEATLNPETMCVLFCGEKHCPDFTPKTKEKDKFIS